MGIFLGLDASTQSLSALVIDTDKAAVLVDESVNFGSELPSYGSPHGVLPNPDPAVRHSDPLMWVEALDLLMSRVASKGFRWDRVDAVSGAGQQHGSVYLRQSLALAASGPALKEQLAPQLSYPTSPMWMDSSTGPECTEIAAAMPGGAETVLRRSGSLPIERFTGPQIRKIWKKSPERYAQTREVHLVSSLFASLLCGQSAPIDLGDGAGMNLLNLQSSKFDADLLEATAPGLGSKLLPPVPSTQQVGHVHEYFRARYGLRAVPVYAFTGDNPSSLIGLGASKPGSRVVSLGTSDTIFGAFDRPLTDPNGYGHVFGNPAGGFMSLVCFTNGSLAREAIAKRCGLDWKAFAQAIESSPAGSEGRFVLPFFSPESTPRVRQAGVQFFSATGVEAEPPASALPRAVVESQALLMRHFCRWMGEAKGELRLTGGASQNSGIQRILADVFQQPLRLLSVTNASALGAALRAAQANLGASFDAVSEPFLSRMQSEGIAPNPKVSAVYDELEARLAARVKERLASDAG